MWQLHAFMNMCPWSPPHCSHGQDCVSAYFAYMDSSSHQGRARANERGHADQEVLEGCSVVVYRVKQCACCTELEDVEPGGVMLVNLLLARPCARRSGFLWRLPEGDLVATMELQVGTTCSGMTHCMSNHCSYATSYHTFS